MFARLGLIAIAVFLSPVLARGDVLVTSTTEAVEVGRDVAVGATISIPLLLSSDDSGVAAVSLDVTCKTEAIRIKGVSFNPVLKLVLAESPEPLPGLAACRT